MGEKTIDYQQELEENRPYWESILGKAACERLLVNDIQEEVWEERSEEFILLDALCHEMLSEKTGWEEYSLKGSFGYFFRFFGRLAVRYAELSDLSGLKCPKDIILSNLYPAIEWIPMRVLIREIHRCAEEGLLRGNTGEEKYRDYQEKYLADGEYIRRLCESYPEMKRLLFLRICEVVGRLRGIVAAAVGDFERLNSDFFPGNPFSVIENIESGLSDSHRGGQSVAKLYLDNQEVLVYKPRNLKKEQCFLELYRFFCEETGLPMKGLPILYRDTYSWEACVEQKPCENEAEVKRFFERTGVLLFLCYLMNVSDMHGENIIASGEYPVPIDLEVLPGYCDDEACSDAKQLIRRELRYSVIGTGILPVIAWGDDGEGIILNAIHNGGVIKAPFQVPVISHPESTDICITYRKGERELSGSLPVFRGKAAKPASYREEIGKGFQKAYRLFLEKKESLQKDFEALFEGESRCLLRHTQQYHMYLRASFYPELLESGKRRRLFFHVLDKSGITEEALASERAALYQMDIPIFYIRGKRRELLNEKGRECGEFLEKSPFESWKEKLAAFGEKDLDRQLSLIALSLGLLTERTYIRRKEPVRRTDKVADRVKEQAKKAADCLDTMMSVYQGEDIGFYSPQAEEEGNYQICPMGMYLYDGIGGIAVFLAAILRENPCEPYSSIFELAVRKLFRYTQSVLSDAGAAESEHTGAFWGEGSIVYTYLLLYELRGEERFLTWAKKHIEIVARLLDTEKSMDYLSGLSGAAVVFLKLFRRTGEKSYLEMGLRAEERVWNCCEIQGASAGWPMREGTEPLAGMAHGNSGLILMYGYLLEETRDGRYREKIEKLLAYEESLYENGNWKDLRHPGGKRYANNAWCHGAAGILLSRLKLRQAGYEDPEGRVERDIERCRQVFLADEEPEELCLCHGLAGNYLALRQYLQFEKDEELEREKRELGLRILQRLEREDVSSREKYNAGLMTGNIGVVLALCEGSAPVNLLG